MTSPERAAEGSAAFSGWKFRAVVWSAVAAALAYIGLALWGGREGMLDALHQIGFTGVMVSLGLSLVNYGLRFVRWQIYLREMGHPVAALPSVRIYLAGFALTTTPAKAGEALRSLFLRAWGVPYACSITALLSERMSDMLAVLVLSLLGLAAYPDARPMVGFGMACVIGAYLLISSQWLVRIVQPAITGSGRLPRTIRRLSELLMQARACHVPRVIVPAMCLGLLAWAAEAWALHLILKWMGADIGVALAMSIYAISMLAGALSFMPGGLGGAEVAMIALLKAAGVDMAQAVSATVIIRLATLWFAVGLGLIALMGVPRKISDVR